MKKTKVRGRITKKNYPLLLKRKAWKKLRLLILKRDGNKCTMCNNTKRLQVHHKYYILGRLPWQYPKSALTTLCYSCHRKVHKNRKISSFIRKK